jgi:hypothetical protein
MNKGGNLMKRIMVSNGMRGKENVEQYIENCRTAVDAYYQKRGEEFERINTFFADFDGNRLQFLGKSILEGLALADEVVFMDDWENYDGCRCEHFIAVQYGVKCVYLNAYQKKDEA